VRGLRVAYGALRAVDGVDLDLARGELLGLVGESGSGKSSLVRTLAGLVRAEAGSARFEGVELAALGRRAWRPLRRRIQLVFQDPGTSLDPRLRVGASVAEPLAIHRALPRTERPARVAALLQQVGLDPAFAARRPHELSGGERQRVGIARALALEPDLLLLDEPVSALDVSVQAQVLNLLAELRAARGFAAILVAHQLGVVRHLADRVAVLFAGRLAEDAPTDALFAAPLHPYTRALLAAAPRPRPGAPPAPGRAGPAAGTGCAFRLRCPLADLRCEREEPVSVELVPGHRVACHRPGEGG
jgi:oligopeptide/dipeptide ABC transporter ATP-binding protein